MSLHVWIFNVGRGLCVALQPPSGHLVMIDCGCSEDFSPVDVLSKCSWTMRNKYKLTKLIITHPHLDHICDIENLTAKMAPSMIRRRKDLKWNRVISGGSDETSPLSFYAKYYMPPDTNYTEPTTDPDWGDGFELSHYCLSENSAERISLTDSEYVNNSSYMTTLKYKSYTFAIAGDNLGEGISELLKEKSDLRDDIKNGVDFLLTPHHGHPSGFCKDWFDVTGPTSIFNIASERRKSSRENESQTQIDARYSQEAYSEGRNKAKRRLVSTKIPDTQAIYIRINDSGTWSWEFLSSVGP